LAPRKGKAVKVCMYVYVFLKSDCSRYWLSELRHWSNKLDVVGTILVTTEFFLISCDSNQVSRWFGTHYNLEVPL